MKKSYFLVVLNIGVLDKALILTSSLLKKNLYVSGNGMFEVTGKHFR